MVQSLTSGSPARRIFGFAWPLLVGNLFQQLYNMADTLIVGRTIGVEALAAVGSTGSLMFLLIGFSQGMTSGFSIITAQYFGAKRMAEVRKSFCVSIALSLLAAFVLTLLGLVHVREVLALMRTPPEIMQDAQAYLSTIYAGLGAFVAFNLLANSILALGDSKSPLLFLIIACILNIILDFTFILGFGWGVAGAARATVVSQGVSVLLCAVYIVKRQPSLLLRKKDWLHARPRDLFRSLRVGLPMGFQASIISVGIIIVQWAFNSLGPIAVAAYTVAQKIDLVAVLPMMSFGLAMATYTGQNYGARDIARIRKGVRQCCAMSLTFSVLVGAAVILGGKWAIALFVGPGQPEVMAGAQIYLNISGVMYWVLALLFIFRFTLQGLGRSAVPTLAGVMELLMRAGAALLLLDSFGYAGVCTANALAWVGACVPLGIAYAVVIRRLAASMPSPTPRQSK
ncbi:MAG: MATE family efflux transporter [Deltaproteobacteria bacterium]|jgi:putative MATE family efflux protein|nr:MATE family efflux transporter [Deltaproteobacteria bacterium]